MLILISAAPPTAAAFENLNLAMAQLLRQNPDGVLIHSVVQERCGVPDERGRKASAAFFQENEQHLKGMAAVIEGTGFVAGTARSVVTAIAMLSRSKVPTKIFDTVSSAAMWQAGLMTARPEPGLSSELVAAVEQARAEFRRGR